MKTLVAALLTLCALFQPGCNGDKAAACDSAGDSSPPSTACDVVMCAGSNMSFPTFDKTCTSPDDCAFAIHQTNCCGATLAVGLTKAEQTRFAADEKTCVDQYPLCACPAVPTVTEDGQSASAGKTIVVECQSGKCMTTVK
jgi:hypothetical protein